MMPFALLELTSRAIISGSTVGAGPAVVGGIVPRSAVGSTPRGVVPVGGICVAALVGVGLVVSTAGVITVGVITTRIITIGAGVEAAGLIVIADLVGPVALATAVVRAGAQDASLVGLSGGENLDVRVFLDVFVVGFEDDVMHLPACVDSASLVVFTLVDLPF